MRGDGLAAQGQFLGEGMAATGGARQS